MVEADAAAALLVLGHGAGAPMTHPFMEALASALAAERISTLRYNFAYAEAGRRRPDHVRRLLAVVRSALRAGRERAGGLPLLAGGKSMGGRMASNLVADHAQRGRGTAAGVDGLVFFGFPLHAPGRRGTERGEHLMHVPLSHALPPGNARPSRRPRPARAAPRPRRPARHAARRRRRRPFAEAVEALGPHARRRPRRGRGGYGAVGRADRRGRRGDPVSTRDNPVSTRDNPLLEGGFPVPFDRIEAGDVAPAVGEVLRCAEERIEALGAGSGGNWDEVIGELDALSEDVSRTWAPVSHLHNVDATPALREAYAATLTEITRFSSRLHHHEGLFRRLRDFAASPRGRALGGLRRRHLDRTLRDFPARPARSSPPKTSSRWRRCGSSFQNWGAAFEENLLEETAAYGKLVTREESLAGMPETALERAAQLAADRGDEGWLLTLDMPAVQAVLQHADDRALRREIHTAFLDRCTAGARDNRALVVRILRLRRRLADLLGYDDFPGYRLETLMARSGDRVRGFLDELIDGTRPYHRRDTEELEEHARGCGLGALEPWDVSRGSWRRCAGSASTSTTRGCVPWFPLDEVQSGLFEIAERPLRAHGRTGRQPRRPGMATSASSRCVTSAASTSGPFYTDWFPRDTKRQGAWMDSPRLGRPHPGRRIRPPPGLHPAATSARPRRHVRRC